MCRFSILPYPLRRGQLYGRIYNMSKNTDEITKAEIVGIRHSLGYTQPDLAATMAVSVHAVRSWERVRNRTNPPGPSRIILRQLKRVGVAIAAQSGGSFKKIPETPSQGVDADS